ncbi:hypothetical protein SAMD00019534_106750, partial [Acytostelium subglobosum LB1]|uniref:hypothetical protein n=1 Tax=Acytostelium subglobosum LB1 TaxID=1410327 RepID=UPI000645179A
MNTLKRLNINRLVRYNVNNYIGPLAYYSTTSLWNSKGATHQSQSRLNRVSTATATGGGGANDNEFFNDSEKFDVPVLEFIIKRNVSMVGNRQGSAVIPEKASATNLKKKVGFKTPRDTTREFSLGVD